MTLIALIPVVGFDVTFDHVTLPGIGDHDLGWAAYPLTIAVDRRSSPTS